MLQMLKGKLGLVAGCCAGSLAVGLVLGARCWECVVDASAADGNYSVSSTSAAASAADCSGYTGGQCPGSSRSGQCAICENPGWAIDSSGDRASLSEGHETDRKKGMCRILPGGGYVLLGRCRWMCSYRQSETRVWGERWDVDTRCRESRRPVSVPTDRDRPEG